MSDRWCLIFNICLMLGQLPYMNQKIYFPNVYLVPGIQSLNLHKNAKLFNSKMCFKPFYFAGSIHAAFGERKLILLQISSKIYNIDHCLKYCLCVYNSDLILILIHPRCSEAISRFCEVNDPDEDTGHAHAGDGDDETIFPKVGRCQYSKVESGTRWVEKVVVFLNAFWSLSIKKMGSGCGAVGRAVASDSRGLRFESSHRQKFI